jgi:Family of unknown function (DUF7019)
LQPLRLHRIRARLAENTGHRGLRMRYYVYVSDTKVDMLFAQIPVALRDRLAAGLKIDLKLVAVSLREKATDETRYSKLQLVCDFLERESLVGAPQEQAEFVHATLLMHWGPLRNAGAPGMDVGAVFFSHVSDASVVGLGGSAKHLIGASGESAAHIFSSAFGIVHAIVAEWGEAPASHPSDLEAARRLTSLGPDYQPSTVKDALPKHEALDAVLWAARMMTGPEQRLEFLAKPLLRSGTYGDAERPDVLLGSPIYVALAD